MTNRVVFDTPALHCDGCIAAVGSVLEGFPGVHAIESDLSSLTLTIDYDLTSITPQAMKAQLASIGYPVAAARDL